MIQLLFDTTIAPTARVPSRGICVRCHLRTNPLFKNVIVLITMKIKVLLIYPTHYKAPH